MISNPLVSIIVPIYNAEKYLDKCIASIAKQTYANIEILLINDGSNDRTESICQEFAQGDNRIRYYYQSNSGVSEARNKGLDEAKGDYFLFVDSDDWLKENAVEEFVRVALVEEADVTILKRYVVCKSGVLFESQKDLEQYSHDNLVEELLLDKIGNHVIIKLFRKDVWEGLRFLKGIVYEDMYVMAQIVLKAKKIVYREIPVYYYNRANEDSLTAAKNNFNAHHRFSKFLAYTAHEQAGSALNNEKVIIWSVEHALHEIVKAYIIDGGSKRLNIESKEKMQKYIFEHEQFINRLNPKDRFFLWSIMDKALFCSLYGKIEALIKG